MDLLAPATALAEFSVETGLRMPNATGLLWSQVDLKRRLLIVPAARAKAGETIAIPLSNRALAVLKVHQGDHATHVFSFRGKSLDDANDATFKAAAKAAGVPWLRYAHLSPQSICVPMPSTEGAQPSANGRDAS